MLRYCFVIFFLIFSLKGNTTPLAQNIQQNVYNNINTKDTSILSPFYLDKFRGSYIGETKISPETEYSENPFTATAQVLDYETNKLLLRNLAIEGDSIIILIDKNNYTLWGPNIINCYILDTDSFYYTYKYINGHLINYNDPKLFIELSAYAHYIWYIAFCDIILTKKKFPVSLSDSLVLIDLFENLNGNNWENNDFWLQDSCVKYWHGISLLDSTILKISLPNNNLTGAIPESINNLEDIEILNLKGNKINEIPDFDKFSEIKTIDIRLNNLDFNDLLKLADNTNFEKIIYYPQKAITNDTIFYLNEGDNFSYSIELYSNVSYQWYLNSISLENQNTNTLNFEFNPSKIGEYHCELTHPDLPELTLKTGSVQLSRATSIIDNLTESKFSIIPNPSQGIFSIQLLNEINAGQIQICTLNGTILFSQTINHKRIYHFDISQQPKGIYLVIVIDEDKVFTQKIILQ